MRDVDELHRSRKTWYQSEKQKGFGSLVVFSTCASRFHLTLICLSSFWPGIPIAYRRSASCGVSTAGWPRQPRQRLWFCLCSPHTRNSGVKPAASQLLRSTLPSSSLCIKHTEAWNSIEWLLDQPNVGTVLSQGWSTPCFIHFKSIQMHNDGSVKWARHHWVTRQISNTGWRRTPK